MERGLGDPAARGDACRRTPEGKQREFPQPPVEFVAQFGGLGVMIRDLSPVGWIHRPWRGAEIHAGIHIVPPEHVGTGEPRIAPFARFPDLLAGNQPVRLAPKPYLRLISEISTICNGANVGGC